MRFFIICAAILATTPSLAADMANVPTGQQLTDADHNVQTVYGQEIEAARSIEARRSLALRMLRTASEEKDSATRYAILQEARRQAISGMDALLGYQITQTLATSFGYPPANNPKPDEWIARGDKLRADAKKETNRKEALTTKLFAAECYLRANPNATGLGKELAEKRILDLALDGHSRKMADFLLLIGTWDVEGADKFRGKWTFLPDGTVTSTAGIKKGQWMLEPRCVKVYWEQKDAWDTFNRPLSLSNVFGDSWKGIDAIRAEKCLTNDSRQ